MSQRPFLITVKFAQPSQLAPNAPVIIVHEDYQISPISDTMSIKLYKMGVPLSSMLLPDGPHERQEFYDKTQIIISPNAAVEIK
jgi:hypothetical protein